MLPAADLATWPGQYKIAPWESSRLTAADVVGPDGIVYPDFTGVGVTGGIPDINNATVRAGYTVFNVMDYGAVADGVTNDDAAVASAANAASNHLNASSANKAILYFPAGTYVLDTPVTFTQSNLVIDGDGPDATVIKLSTNTAQTGALFTLAKPPAFSGYLTVSAFAPRGTNTLSLSGDPATNTFTVGSWVRVHPTVSGAGKTVSDRFSNPDNGVTYTDAFWHTGRITFAKITDMNSAARTVTLDRTFTHDYFVDESPQLRRMSIMEYSGIQDLTIETVAATVTIDPIKFDTAANCWIKNIKTIKARNWPIYTTSVTRFEVRDSQFLGTWININQGGGVAYLGWCDPATDSLMENCQASDLRHMAIFQLSNRCVIRNSTFTGQSIQSPQLHGRFPHENLIEGTTFNNLAHGGASSRGITSFGSDGGYSTVHGVNGPRNVYYNNTVLAGMGSANFSGISEGFIFAYNRILKNHDTEAKPPILAMDRTFDMTLRGNIFQAITTLPALSINERTCTGWDVADNKFYGTNGYLFEGDSEPALTHNNRFFPIATTPAAATTPEVASIYAWQKVNAHLARLVVVAERRTVTDTGGTTAATVVRVKSSTASDLTVALSADVAGLSFPDSVVIPAGQTSATFTLTGLNVSGGEKFVTLTASASGLLPDSEKISILDQDVTQPNFGGLNWPAPAPGLPANWKAGNYGIVTTAGSQSYNSATDTWSITGAGVATETFHASLVRAGRKFVYQTVDGDGEIRARITSASGENQVGLMMADDEATHTDFIWVEPNGRVYSSSNNPDNGLGNGVPTQRVAAGTKVVPCWLRLKRTGSTFTAYRSTVTSPASEADWTVLATVNLYTTSSSSYHSPAILDQRMHYGMFINSGSPTNTATSTFTNVQITGDVVGTVTPPAAPTDLNATLEGNTQANLSWTDTASDETGFEIELRIGTSPAWIPLATVAADATTHSHTGLLDGMTYAYRVRAIRSDDSTASEYAGPTSITTPLTSTPLPPSGGNATSLSESEIELSWMDNAHNESSYEIERSTQSGSDFTLLTTLGTNASGYVDSGVPDGTRYYYRVRAVNALGSSTFSSAVAGVSRLGAPSGLVITSATDTDIALQWSDNSANETGHSVERSTSGSGFAQIGSVGANVTTFIDTSVVPDTTYNYRVRAINAVALSDYTSQASATATAYVAAEFYEPFNHSLSPTSVIGRTGTGVGSAGNWSVISGNLPADSLLPGNLSAGRMPPAGNQLRVGETSNSSRISINLANEAKTVISPPANGSRTFWISYLVRTPSTFANATPSIDLSTSTGIRVVTLFAHTGNNNRRYSIGGDNLTTVNSANDGITTSTDYCYIAKVTVGDTDGNAANGLESVEARLWQFPQGSLPPLTEPTSGGIYRSPTAVTSRVIHRLDLTGGSANSASRFIFDEVRVGSSYAQVAVTPPPTAPSNLVFSNLTTSTVTLTWKDNATNETGYKIQRATSSGGPYSTVATLAANSTGYTDTGLAAGATYYYRVRSAGEVYDSSPATGNITTSGFMPAPIVAGGQTASGSVGANFAYTLQTNHSPTGYAHAGGTMPPGLTLDITTGMIGGTPTTAGNYSPLFTATNAAGTSPTVAVGFTIAPADSGSLLVYEPFNYPLSTTNPDPDAGINSNNGLPTTNSGGTPSDTSVGFYGSYGTDHSVVAGLSYSDATGTLSSSANALQRTSGTGFSVALTRIYRQMSVDPFAIYRSSAEPNLLGWNGTSARKLYFSVLLNVSRLQTGTDNRLVLNLGTDNNSWNVYLAQSNTSTKWRYGDQAGTGADLGNAVADQTVLIVGRLSFNSATQFVTEYWFNPPLGQALTTPTFAKTYTTTTSGGQFRGIQTRDGAGIFTYDEFRLGTSFAAVTPYTIPDPLPTAPTDLAAASASATQINLTWTDTATNETGYRVERSVNGTTGWAQIATPAANTIAHSDTGLAPGSIHYYRVFATNATGDSAASNTASAATPLLGQSITFDALPDKTDLDIDFTLDATASSGLTITYTSSNEEVATVEGNLVTISGTGTTTITAYQGGNASYAPASPVPQTFTVKQSPPAAPSDLAATASSASQISLTWIDNSADETGFEIERSADGTTGWIQIAAPAANTIDHADSALSTGTTYYYRVRATNIFLESPFSNIAQATTLNGVEDFRSSNGLAADGSQDTATPAGDGIANLLKYAFNMIGTGDGQVPSPITPNSAILAPDGMAGLPFGHIGAGTGNFRITYIRRTSLSNPGITYAVEFTADPGVTDSWAIEPSAIEQPDPIDANFERVTVTDSSSVGSKRFARVKVTTP